MNTIHPPITHYLYLDDDEDDVFLFNRAFPDSPYHQAHSFTQFEKFKITLSGLIGKQERVVAIVDLNMPEISGFDIIKILRAQSSTKTIPILCFTTSNSPHDAKDAYSFGSLGYFVKPNSLKAYQNLLSDISRYWDSAIL